MHFLKFVVEKHSPRGKLIFILDKKKAIALDQLSFALWLDEIITFFSVILPYHNKMHVWVGGFADVGNSNEKEF